jgi:peptide deformylase
VLRGARESAGPADIKSPRIQQLIDDMFETMQEYQGVGLAAPQVHASVRLFVAGFPPTATTTRTTTREERAADGAHQPEITPLGTDVDEDWEGCLSIPDIRGRVQSLRRDIEVKASIGAAAHLIRARGFNRARHPARGPTTSTGVLFFDRMKSFETLTF